MQGSGTRTESSNLAAPVFKINDCTSAELVPVRILNTSDKVQTISAQTVVAVTKPLTSVVELEVPKQTSDIPKIAVRKIHEGGDESGETIPDPLKELSQRTSEQLTEEESQAVAEVLHRRKDVFSLSEQDLSRTNLTNHHIVMGNERGIKQHPRRTSLANNVEIKRQVEDLLQRGFVKKSNSPWFSPEVLVTKKDGSQRFCVDYIQVNAVTVKDAYPLQRIDGSLSGTWFSTLDLSSAYWQVPLDLASSGKAAFETTSGL